MINHVLRKRPKVTNACEINELIIFYCALSNVQIYQFIDKKYCFELCTILKGKGNYRHHHCDRMLDELCVY